MSREFEVPEGYNDKDAVPEPSGFNRASMEAALTQARASEEIMESLLLIGSKQLYQRYTGLQEAGFTEEQAFTIILQRGIN